MTGVEISHIFYVLRTKKGDHKLFTKDCTLNFNSMFHMKIYELVLLYFVGYNMTFGKI